MQPIYGIRKHQHISFERKQQHPDSDFSGKLLHDMCQATHLINLTGITSADSPVQLQHPSSAPTLAKHRNLLGLTIIIMLLSPLALQHLEQHQVLGHLLGSDHLPLQIVLSLSTRPAPSSSASQQQQATLQQNLIIPSKDRETVQRYIAAMADPATLLSLMSCASWRTLVKHQLKR
jgi:hypothetical protein